MSGCLTRSELESLLGDDLTSRDNGRLEAHLGECEACETRFDAMLLDTQDEWREWKSLLAGSTTLDRHHALVTANRNQLEAHFASRGFVDVCEIGSGGMGLVFRAFQPALSRYVAIKMLIGGALAGPDRLARLAAEAKAQAKLRHHSILQIYSVEEFEGLPYLILEYVDGGTLAEKLSDSPLAERRAATLVLEVSRAVAHAHEHGIVHRDIKPSNILFSDGEPRLADFGLAKREDAEALTGTEILGTPAYMSPEQAQAGRYEIGVHSDVYALGVLLYESLCGVAPFQASSTVETLRSIVEDLPAAPRSLRASISRDLETICLKCLEKSPRDRYASADALAEDLRRFLVDEPILARRPSVLKRVWYWGKRSPVQAALALLSLVLVCFLFGLWARFTVEVKRERDLTLQHSEFAKENFVRAQAAIRNYLESFRTHTPLGSKSNLAFQEETIQTGLDFYKELIESTQTHELGDFGSGYEGVNRARLDYAALLLEYAKVNQVAGNFEKSYEAYLQAIAICEPLNQTEDFRNQALELTSAALMSSVHVAFKLKGFEAALENARRSLECNASLGSLGKDGDGQSNWYQAIGHLQAGQIQFEVGRIKDSIESFELADRFAGYLPGISDYEMTKGQIWLAISMSNRALGRYDLARQYCSRAVRQFETLALRIPQEMIYPRYERWLAKTYVERSHCFGMGELETQAAAASLEMAILVLMSLSERYPTVESYREEIAQALDVARDSESAHMQALVERYLPWQRGGESGIGASDNQSYAELTKLLNSYIRIARSGKMNAAEKELVLAERTLEEATDFPGREYLARRVERARMHHLFSCGAYASLLQYYESLEQETLDTPELETMLAVSCVQLKDAQRRSFVPLKELASKYEMNSQEAWLDYLQVQEIVQAKDWARLVPLLRSMTDAMNCASESSTEGLRAMLHVEKSLETTIAVPTENGDVVFESDADRAVYDAFQCALKTRLASAKATTLRRISFDPEIAACVEELR